MQLRGRPSSAARGMSNRKSLHVDEEIPFEDELALLVLLGLFVCSILCTTTVVSLAYGSANQQQETYVFPAQSLPALAAVDIAHGVVTRRHDSVIRFALNDVHTTYAHLISDQSITNRTGDSHSIE